ncbi:TIR domain-containing protein [Vibrio cholerae]|uniref:TIR domain-containing protein n=1 Tax=Vibrio cholerae TaxID=666 RepID=UPI0011D382E6|nr:nucleotide-binding protein [Vibrio cholerae]EGR2423399.1 DNA-binding protein [Vibrio cholerae]TXZ53485.1 DNA-binding protein [Vibrio cholerae]GHW84406.1 DNA-binding protein [Vibrio cholerae]
MFYHVLIETKEKTGKNNKNKQIFELDFTDKSKIISEIVAPYLSGHEFQFDGYFLTKSEIIRIVVRESELDSSTLSKNANNNLAPGVIFFISRESAVQSDTHTKDITKDIFKEVKKINDNQPSIVSDTDSEMNCVTNKNQVFVVHGHDNLAKLEVSSFIKDLGFEPIILHEQASGGHTIIEKIENYSNVGFGVVLYTPCDLGAKNEEKFQPSPRARQNVVFEHGYLIGKLKRGNVCALVKGQVETPNDISGVVYVNLDDHGAWKIALAKELRKAGYDVDMNNVL